MTEEKQEPAEDAALATIAESASFDDGVEDDDITFQGVSPIPGVATP